MTADATLAARARHNMAPRMDGGQEDGLDGWLTKPLLPEAVGRLLAEQLAR